MDITGYYFLVGEQSSVSRPIKWVELSSTNKRGQIRNLRGSIRLDQPPINGRYISLNLTSLHLVGDNLRFQSRAREGVSYEFSGRFLRLADLKEIVSPDEVLLEGQLKQLRKGKLESEANVTFRYETGD